MSTTKAKWPYVTKAHPCPICSRPDWCQISTDGKVVKCQRMQSDRAAKGSGWLHFTDGKAPSPPRPHISKSMAAPRRSDLHLLAAKFRSRCSDRWLSTLSRQLGLSLATLHRLDVGWSDGEEMYSERVGDLINVYGWSFPMRNADEAVVGIKIRTKKGAKFSFTGGRGGLFIPRGFYDRTGGRGYLLEGPTDLGAALDLGLTAFGRDNNLAGADDIAAVLSRRRFDELVIFAQRDIVHLRDKYRPEKGIWFPSQNGAIRIAPRARLYCPSVRIIRPPATRGRKVDVRDWMHAGATAADVEQLVTEARLISLKFTTPNKSMPMEGATL